MSTLNTPVLHGFLIDDDVNARASATRFSSINLKLEFLQPESLEDFAIKIFSSKPAIVILDYRLDERAGEFSPAVRYKASALAQQLRDLAGEDGTTDFPIVLHSAEENLKRLFGPEKTSHDLFDAVITKSANKDSNINESLYDLACSYALIRRFKPYNNNCKAIFGLTEGSAHLIDHQEIQNILGTAGSPHVLARFIINKLLQRNSILADLPTLLARCGVDQSDEIGKNKIIDELRTAGANYSGVFSIAYEKWWRFLLDEEINKWLDAPLARLNGSERVQRLNKYFSHQFKPAVSTWNGSSNEKFTHACVICEHPTLIAQSVGVLEHSGGPLIEKRRVCFDCIQVDRHINPGVSRKNIVIDSLDKSTEDLVRRGDIARK